MKPFAEPIIIDLLEIVALSAVAYYQGCCDGMLTTIVVGLYGVCEIVGNVT